MATLCQKRKKQMLTVSTRKSIRDARCFENRGSSFEIRESRIENRVFEGKVEKKFRGET